MYKKLHFFLKYMASWILSKMSFINRLIHKNNNFIFIYNSKETYHNNYALFKYLIENNYNDYYKIIYEMPNVNHYIKKTNNVILIEFRKKFGFIKAIYWLMKSKYVFYDNSNLRISAHGGQKIINLWHGTPLKKIGFMSNSATILTKNALNCYSHILLSNEIQDDIYLESFNIKKEQILHLGYPRNDLLENTGNKFCKVIENYDSFDKHIIWMTTYRITNDGISHTTNKNWSQTGIPLLTDKTILLEINEYLKENNTLLIVKMHQNNSQNNLTDINYSNIYYLSEDQVLREGLQMYELLEDTDALITDYSSIYFDYLLLNKQIGFILDDLSIYKEKNGLYYEDIDKYLPGEHIYNLEELKQFINNLTLNIDRNENKRKNVNDEFNKYDQQGNNTEKLLDFLNIKKVMR